MYRLAEPRPPRSQNRKVRKPLTGVGEEARTSPPRDWKKTVRKMTRTAEKTKMGTMRQMTSLQVKDRRKR